uniref:Uncharacterized protein MANES_11G021000 n=1 Tax=Rhizophora mucronata TaxID=61149 RepID=A0A2P2KXT3_RHIMU
MTLLVQVNAYASVRVVDALYHSKYFLMSSAGFHHDLKLDSVKKSLQRSNDNHVIYQPQNCCVVGANSQTGVITTNNDVHKVTILNLPEEVVPLDGAKVINGHQGYWQDENPLGSTNASETLESFCQESTVPILPWINGDGTINKFIYNGLVRRVFGTVMQNPGILEDGIIRRIDALNPQSCRTLLDLMILDKQIVARDMLQSTSRGPPPLLGTLLGNSYRESKLVYRRHFSANPKSASLL